MANALNPKTNKRPMALLVWIGLLITLLLLAIRFWPSEPLAPAGEAPPASTGKGEPATAERGATIPLDPIAQSPEDQALQEARKKQYRVDRGVDAIAQSDEEATLQGHRISMREIQELIRQKIGGIAEESIGSDGGPGAVPIEMFGLYVVQPGDNIWDVHFHLLQDHLRSREVDLPPRADEPDPMGYSSGVGKLLKFSENLVFIYNIKERALDSDLNVIEPYTKILVYKMDAIIGILDNIDPSQLDQIRFDGDTLWIPPPS